ncbi:hypothetical protein OROGR_004109 [Orobanche gracilis]
MAQIDQNLTEPEQDHEPGYETKNEHENEIANERLPEVAHVHEHEGEKHELEDRLPENFHPEEQDNANETADGGADKWPGWPGESVFRMLVPAQKVGGIIGRKGEYIKKTCEETKARIKILDGPPGTRERATGFSNQTC